MIRISSDGLASLLAAAFKEGWESGRNLCPEPDPAQTFIEYQVAVEDMCTENVRH
jgi:hypothetical protein